MTALPSNSLSYVPNYESDTAARAWIDNHKDCTGYVNGQWLTAAVAPAQVAGATKEALRTGTPNIAGCLHALSTCIQSKAELRAVFDSLSSGQPIQRSQKLSVPLAARYAQYYVGWALRTEEERGEWAHPGVIILELVTASVLLVDLMRQAVWALAEGNVLVINAPVGSYSALLFADLCAQAELPPGIVNVVIGGVAASHWHKPRQARITSDLAPTVLIFDDADLDGAVEGAVEALWFNPNRARQSGAKLLVQETVANSVRAKLRTRIDTIRSGDALDKTIDISNVQSSGGALELDDVAASVMQTFGTYAEATSILNHLKAATVSLWTESVGLAVELAHTIKTTTVWVNAVDLYDPALDSRITPKSVEAMPRPPTPWMPATGHPERQQLESLYINGRFVRSESGETRMISGVNNRLLAEISVGSKVDIDKAIGAAAVAADKWLETSSTDRVRIVYRLADLMRSHKTRMADSIAARTGEPRDRAEAVVDLRIEQLLSTTATADNIARSQQQVTYMPHRALALTVPESIGVLGVIDPVSLLYELAQVIGKVLANCVTAVIIPSERYPLTVLAFCELLTLAEVPPGVINVVPGDQTKLTAALIENQNVTLWQPSGTQPLPVHVKTIWLPYGV